MQNVLLNDGRTVIIGGMKDVIEVVGENLGYEISDVLNGFYADQIKEYKYIADAESKEKEAMESDLEDTQQLLHGTMDSIEEIIDYMEEARRMDKQKVIKRLSEIRREIYRNL